MVHLTQASEQDTNRQKVKSLPSTCPHPYHPTPPPPNCAPSIWIQRPNFSSMFVGWPCCPLASSWLHHLDNLWPRSMEDPKRAFFHVGAIGAVHSYFFYLPTRHSAPRVTSPLMRAHDQFKARTASADRTSEVRSPHPTGRAPNSEHWPLVLEVS